jgi:hypothetical protein
VGLANLGSESETCVGSRVHLFGISISIQKIFYRLPFTPPLSGSSYRSFTCTCAFADVANPNAAPVSTVLSLLVNPAFVPSVPSQDCCLWCCSLPSCRAFHERAAVVLPRAAPGLAVFTNRRLWNRCVR